MSTDSSNLEIFQKKKMICHFALIIALLCFKPSRGALLNDFRITKTAAGHDPLLNAQNIVNVDLMSEQASRAIHENYLKSQKRLILLDDDVSLILLHDS